MATFTLRHGLRNIYYALVQSDNNETTGALQGYLTATPKTLIPAGELSITTANDKTDTYFDNSIFATVGREESTEIQITGAALSPDIIAELTGKSINAATGAILDSGEYTPTYFAICGTIDNIDGTEEKFWFLKGTFAIPDQNDKTKDDTTDTNGMTLTFTAIPTAHKFSTTTHVAKRLTFDSGVTRFKTGKTWEGQVVTPENLSTICEIIPTT